LPSVRPRAVLQPFFHVLSRIPARYWLGLTATPERRNGLEDLIYHQLGSHHVTIESTGAGQLPTDGSDLLTPQPVLRLHPTGFRYTGDADPSAPGGMAEIYRTLIADEDRLDQIVHDILRAAEAGANILVLTTWVDHLNAIAERARAAGKNRHGFERGYQSPRTPPDRRGTRQPGSRFRAAVDRRHKLVHARGLRLPRTRHPFPGRSDHLQEPTGPVHRANHPPLPIEDHRNCARLLRRTHPRHRLIAEKARPGLPQDGVPRPTLTSVTTRSWGLSVRPIFFAL